jgi:prepilin-type processing-associated H-X9-DG protein/prepilin-type N-terminal cleavage/methylation domain-containing protein
MRWNFCGRRGFSRTELLVAIVVLAFLMAIAIPLLKQLKPRGAYMSCKHKQQVIYSGLRSTGITENWEMSPFQAPLPATVFQSLSNEISPYSLVCPTDSRKYATNWQPLANSNISYFLSLSSIDSPPQATVLAGDRHVSPRGDVTVDSSTPGFVARWQSELGLHPPRDRKERGLSVPYGNILFADGHVEMLDDAGLARALGNSNGGTNLLAIP